jgi:hypothetical protein
VRPLPGDGAQARGGFFMNPIMTQPFSSRPATVARVPAPTGSLSLSAALGEQLSTLYGLAQQSDYVFGTPLGPFTHGTHSHYVPRFVYFGPHTSEESPRIAFLAGLDSRDLRSTLALLHLVEELARRPDIGQSLHVAFYPLVDVLGHLRQADGRDLPGQRWASATAPELDLLAKDSRLRAYHAFVRVESGPADDAVTLSLRSANGSGLALFSSDDLAPFAVRWEIDREPLPATGPLSLADDLPFRPLDLTLRVPGNWSAEFYREAVASILKRLIVRYREFLAYGQNL